MRRQEDQEIASRAFTCKRCKNNHKDASRLISKDFNLPGLSSKNIIVYGISLHQSNIESRKNLEQKFIFQPGTLAPHGINGRFSFN